MPHRQKIITLLQDYQPGTSEELEFKEQMIRFAENNTDCFERSNLQGHFTGSCWLLDRNAEHALLMHHMKLDRWFQLGGHADGDPDLLVVALKEAQEESGIGCISAVNESIFDIDVHEIPENKNVPKHFHYDVRFLLQVTSSEVFQINSESKELRWISKDAKELPTSSPSVTRMFKKWVAMT